MLFRDLKRAICSHALLENRQAENSNNYKDSRPEWKTLPSFVCQTLLGSGLQDLEKNCQVQRCVAPSYYQATLYMPTEMRVDKGIF